MLLDAIAPKPELIPKLKDLVVQAAEEHLSLSKASQARRKTHRKQLERQLQELIAMRADRLITNNEFLTHKALLDEKRFSLESATETARVNVAAIRDNLDEISKPLTHLPETWQALPILFQRRFHRLVLPVGFVYGESRTAELGLLFMAIGNLVGRNTNGVPPSSKSWNQIMQEIIEFAGLLRASRTAN